MLVVVVLGGRGEFDGEAVVVAKDEPGWFVVDEAEGVDEVAEEVVEDELGNVVLD